MKYIFLLVMVAINRPRALFAHSGGDHVSEVWYQDVSGIGIIIGLLVAGALLGAVAYYAPRYRTILAGIGILSVLVAVIGFHSNQPMPALIPESVSAQLTDVPLTMYRVEGCSCCTGYAAELEAIGVAVTVETITASQMHDLKQKHNITSDQASCHTSVIDEYVVEGHVPFAAVAQLLTDRPAITGITLPGMPAGTPGMPGKQTQVHTVTTLENELFWQSS